MPPNLISVYVRLRKDQVTRLNLLRAAIAEKMGKDMTLSDVVVAAVDDFLNSK